MTKWYKFCLFRKGRHGVPGVTGAKGHKVGITHTWHMLHSLIQYIQTHGPQAEISVNTWINDLQKWGQLDKSHVSDTCTSHTGTARSSGIEGTRWRPRNSGMIIIICRHKLIDITCQSHTERTVTVVNRYHLLITLITQWLVDITCWSHTLNNSLCYIEVHSSLNWWTWSPFSLGADWDEWY